MKQSFLLCYFLWSACLFLSAADRPKGLIEVLDDQFEKDTRQLFVSIGEGNGEEIWNQSSHETQALLPLEEFRRVFSATAAQRASDWTLCYKRLYCLDPFLGPQDQPIEAYMISIIKCTVLEKEEYVQCVWEYDEKSGRWRFKGMPFGFADVPFALRYPALTVKHPERWPKAKPSVE